MGPGNDGGRGGWQPGGGHGPPPDSINRDRFMRTAPPAHLQRRMLTLALLSALSMPVYAGTNCQLVDEATGLALPVDSSAPGTDALACGPRAKANGTGAVAEGAETTATGNNATAVGSWVDLDGDGLVDPDEITWASGDNATAIGAASQAFGTNAVAVGVRAVANLDNSVALGNQSQTQAETTTTVDTFSDDGSPETVTTTSIA